MTLTKAQIIEAQDNWAKGQNTDVQVDYPIKFLDNDLLAKISRVEREHDFLDSPRKG